MSADVARIRRAAALMRERAEGATSGPWGVATTTEMGYAIHRGEHDTVALFADRPNAAHIASWHPLVALAVADWLDAEAESHESEAFAEWSGVTDCCRMPQALAVARAYLGASA